MKALIDADILIYEVATRCERTIAWPDQELEDAILYTRHAYWDEAKVKLEDSIRAVAEAVDAADFVAVVTDSSENWRFDVYGDYKSNRSSGGVKPMLVTPLREWVEQQSWGRCVRPLEGDDVMGILQTKPNGGDTICCTTDKDLATIPGEHYNFTKKKRYSVTEAEANWMHLVQALAGDATDGYPGCPGIGMKTAFDLIDAPVEDREIPWIWDEVIVPAYAKKGLDQEFALSQARCARILRASDYNPKTKEVIPWLPPHYE